jgi:hypothetical protein
VEYDATDLSACRIRLSDFDTTIEVTKSSIKFRSPSTTTPSALLETFKEAQKQLLSNHPVKSLGSELAVRRPRTLPPKYDD